MNLMSIISLLTNDGTSKTWRYDANGNRTHEDGVQVASYDAQDRLTQYKDNSYQYNALGQLTEKTTPGGTETYDYDVFGNLRGVTLANGNTIEYLIDPKDRRIGKKVNGIIKQKLLYLGQLNPIAELYSDNSIKNLFIYADNLDSRVIVTRQEVRRPVVCRAPVDVWLPHQSAIFVRVTQTPQSYPNHPKLPAAYDININPMN